MYKIETLPIESLKEYENNPRDNELAAEKVAVSIKKFGFLFPVVIDADNVIVCGHSRKKACEKVGVKEVPCIRVDDLTPEQVAYFRLVDNKTTEYSTWDLDRLSEELQYIDLDIEMNSLTLDAFDLMDFRMDDFQDIPTEIEMQPNNFLGGSMDFSADDSLEEELEDVEELDEAEEYDPEYFEDVPVRKLPEIPVPDDDEEYEGLDEETDEVELAGPDDDDEDEADEEPTNIAPADEKPEASRKVRFIFGEIKFSISEAEKDMLTDAYTAYMDTVYPAKGFVSYLLGR